MTYLSDNVGSVDGPTVAELARAIHPSDPAGPPEGVNQGGPPDSVPAGPPDGVTPGGPPDSVPGGPPDGVNHGGPTTTVPVNP